jgi:hypothetical protein
MENARMVLKRIFFKMTPPRFVTEDLRILAKIKNIAADLAIGIPVMQTVTKMNAMNVLEPHLVGPERGDVEEGSYLVVITNVGSTSIATNMV